MRRTRGASLLALLLALAPGCGKQLPTRPAVDATARDVAVEMRAARRKDAAEVIGKTQSGALFAMYRPARWKGDLVLYAHGFTPPTDPIHLPPIEDLRDQLLAQGYAVAYSSFSENGLAVRDGIRQTEQLVGRFSDRLGRPRRVFIIGSSFGGLIAVAMAERDPERYAGLLTVSGLIGGSRGLLDYISHVRVLFDAVYPGVLPGDLLHMPPGLNLNQHVVGPAVQAMSTSPQGVGIISLLAPSPVPYASGPELVQSIATALSLHFIEIQDLLQRTNGESFFDNSSRTYSGPLPAALLADINARVARYHSTEDVQEFLDRNYETTGRLRIPMLALSNERDPQVPSWNESRYRERVAKRGRLDLLEQRSFARYGHSEKFTPADIAQAFGELVLRATRDREDDDDDEDRGPHAAVAPVPGAGERQPSAAALRR